MTKQELIRKALGVNYECIQESIQKRMEIGDKSMCQKISDKVEYPWDITEPMIEILREDGFEVEEYIDDEFGRCVEIKW